jgi:hypothetical protein
VTVRTAGNPRSSSLPARWVLALAAAALPLACRSPEESVKQSRAVAASWCATGRETALALNARNVPRAFATDTFRAAGESLEDEVSRLRKLARRSSTAASAAGSVSEAAALARSLADGPGSNLSTAAARFQALEGRIRVREGP